MGTQEPVRDDRTNTSARRTVGTPTPGVITHAPAPTPLPSASGGKPPYVPRAPSAAHPAPLPASKDGSDLEKAASDGRGIDRIHKMGLFPTAGSASSQEEVYIDVYPPAGCLAISRWGTREIVVRYGSVSPGAHVKSYNLGQRAIDDVVNDLVSLLTLRKFSPTKVDQGKGVTTYSVKPPYNKIAGENEDPANIALLLKTRYDSPGKRRGKDGLV